MKAEQERASGRFESKRNDQGTIMKTLLITAAALTGLATMNVEAKVSSQSELRGYSACVEAAQPDFKGLVLNRIYYLDKNAQGNVYYLNGSAWQDGERVAVRISCDTSSNGRTLLTTTNNPGSFALQDGRTPIQIATQ
jgi:hypothetical protein